MRKNKKKTRGVPFTLKIILRQKKNYGNSNISPCKNISNIQKIPLKETKILQDIIINLKFQHKPKYHLSNPKPTDNPKPYFAEH
jgi:hypothetical protein